MMLDFDSDGTATTTGTSSTAPSVSSAMSFPIIERKLLLTVPGIGAGVIARLESVGVHSLSELAALGSDAAVRRVCRQLGTNAWENRRGALDAALRLAGKRFTAGPRS